MNATDTATAPAEVRELTELERLYGPMCSPERIAARREELWQRAVANGRTHNKLEEWFEQNPVELTDEDPELDRFLACIAEMRALGRQQ
jgi:hypothetical protein